MWTPAANDLSAELPSIAGGLAPPRILVAVLRRMGSPPCRPSAACNSTAAAAFADELRGRWPAESPGCGPAASINLASRKQGSGSLVPVCDDDAATAVITDVLRGRGPVPQRSAAAAAIADQTNLASSCRKESSDIASMHSKRERVSE